MKIAFLLFMVAFYSITTQISTFLPQPALSKEVMPSSSQSESVHGILDKGIFSYNNSVIFGTDELANTCIKINDIYGDIKYCDIMVTEGWIKSGNSYAKNVRLYLLKDSSFSYSLTGAGGVGIQFEADCINVKCYDGYSNYETAEYNIAVSQDKDKNSYSLFNMW